VLYGEEMRTRAKGSTRAIGEGTLARSDNGPKGEVIPLSPPILFRQYPLASNKTKTTMS
jgi:hypothetical protein